VTTWSELDAQFQALCADTRFMAIQYQWGVAGTKYYPAGGTEDGMLRFKTLSAQAGEKLAELPAGTVDAEILAVVAPAERWYEALRHHSPTFKHDDIAEQFDPADGRVLGPVYLGRLPDPVQASARLALALSGVPTPRDAPATRTSWLQNANQWLEAHGGRYGKLWAVTAVMLGLVLAAAALL